MRRRVVGMVRFGRSGDTWDDLEREDDQDDDDYGDYENKMDIILKDIMEKEEKVNKHSCKNNKVIDNIFIEEYSSSSEDI